MVKEVLSAALNHFMSKATDKCLPFFKIIKKAFGFKWTPKCEEAFVLLKEYLSQPPFLSKPCQGEDLYLYVAILNDVINAVLI